MIPHTDLQWQTLSWQQELREAFRSADDLLRHLQLPPSTAADKQAHASFPILVPRPFAQRMRAGDSNDPLLLQVLPVAAELNSPAHYSPDPLREAEANPVPGIVHKYRGRVLLIAASGCAVNCRYCFRRHFDYSANNPSQSEWAQHLRYIADDSSISEVILSGGDPLLASDRYLDDLISQLEQIPHLERLRIHSRLPIVLPSRVNDALCQRLQQSRLRCVLVLHCNHPNEIDAEVRATAAKLAASGVLLLNQSVLLAGINDCAATLQKLSEDLFDCGVLPYYLHLLDPVSGAAHFDLPQSRALALHRELSSRCSGYLVPRLVRESPNHPAKVTLAPFQL